MSRRRLVIAGVGLALLAAGAPAHATDEFGYVRDAAASLREGSVAVDTRPLDACKLRSAAGAVCLPADGFLGPQRRLPAERDLLWLLGTAGLAGDETVLVVGQDVVARDFVAGLLYIAGQRRVRVLTEPMGKLLESGIETGPGRERSFVRERVYQAAMRDGIVVLRDELRAMRPAPVLLDGRTEAEYWGEVARSSRSGHLPGAASVPGLALRTGLAAPAARPLLPEGEPVAYGHDAYEGLAYLTLLTAGYGVPARLYLPGWAEWAADGALPVDAAGYPEPPAIRQAEALPPVLQDGVVKAGTLVMVLAAFAAGWWLKRERKN
ncbi:MAG: rhodanese-like domain-containing protein [Thiobacillus sp.]|jgi:thiosulfate/3-mercaptopyruvate sulfurtransferase